jgi:hypothetical protein
MATNQHSRRLGKKSIEALTPQEQIRNYGAGVKNCPCLGGPYHLPESLMHHSSFSSTEGHFKPSLKLVSSLRVAPIFGSEEPAHRSAWPPALCFCPPQFVLQNLARVRRIKHRASHSAVRLLGRPGRLLAVLEWSSVLRDKGRAPTR